LIPDLLKKMADKRNTVTHFVDPEIVSHEEMQGFRYIEHRENVSLALAVCLHAGVDRNTALQGMYKAVPDAGALMVFRVEAFRKNLVFYNAFAANDPDSTFLVWRKISDETGMEGKRIVLLNTRQDRLYRAEQLAGMVAYRLEKEVDYLVLIGQSTDVVESMAIRYGIPARKVVTVGWTTSENVFDRLLALTDHTATIVAIGNMGGMGSGLVEFFEHRSI